jgi:hypothetical protein
MQRRVFRKHTKPGKGGKRQIDGSSHRESFRIEIATGDMAIASVPGGPQVGPADWHQEDPYDDVEGIASLQRLDISRKKQREVERQRWKCETGRDVGDSTRADYLRAVIAPLNWQQDMLVKRDDVKAVDPQLVRKALRLLQESWSMPQKMRTSLRRTLPKASKARRGLANGKPAKHKVYLAASDTRADAGAIFGAMIAREAAHKHPDWYPAARPPLLIINRIRPLDLLDRCPNAPTAADAHRYKSSQMFGGGYWPTLGTQSPSRPGSDSTFSTARAGAWSPRPGASASALRW